MSVAKLGRGGMRRRKKCGMARPRMSWSRADPPPDFLAHQPLCVFRAPRGFATRFCQEHRTREKFSLTWEVNTIYLRSIASQEGMELEPSVLGRRGGSLRGGASRKCPIFRA